MIGSTWWTTFCLAKPCTLGGTAPQPGWTTQFNGVYKVCKHCMLTQSMQLGCSCAWASTQTHKLVQSMPMQKPYKRYDEGEGLRPFEPCREGGTPPSCTPPCVRFSAGGAPKKCGFFSQKSALRIWWFSHVWTFSWENCAFSSKWNRLWRLKASFTIKGLTTTCNQRLLVLFV